MKKRRYKRDITQMQQVNKKEEIILKQQKMLRKVLTQSPQNLEPKISNELYDKMLIDQYLEFSKNTNIYSEKRMYLIIVSLVSSFTSYIMGDYMLLIVVGIIYTLIVIKNIVALDFSPDIINDYDSFIEIEDKTSELLNHISECYNELEYHLKRYIKFEIILILIFVMLKVKIWYLLMLILVYLNNLM